MAVKGSPQRQTPPPCSGVVSQQNVHVSAPAGVFSSAWMRRRDTQRQWQARRACRKAVSGSSDSARAARLEHHAPGTCVVDRSKNPV